MKIIKAILFGLTLALAFTQASGQDLLIKGKVISSADGSPVYMAAVRIENSNKFTFTDESGHFVFNQMVAGKYTLQITCLGFTDCESEIGMTDDHATPTITLTPNSLQIREVRISAERQRYAHSNTIGVYQLNAETIKKVPSIGGQSDLAQFLQTIPGVNFTGDRGGQFYVRGGAPVYNKIMLDGMTIISPFHSIGFMSVFDTEIINIANVYTAGFNAQYSGRLSSIIDLKTRDGNGKRLEGKTSITTFGCDLTLHGPLMKATPTDPRTVSFLLNYKGSYIDKVAPVLYPYLDSMGIPYKYGDFYGKISTTGPDDHMSVFGHHFTDRVSYDDLLTTSWQNNGLGCKMEWGPKGWAFPLIISGTYSDYQAHIQEADKRPQDTRYRDLIWHIGTGMLANKTEIKFAIEWSALMTEYSFMNLGKQNVLLTSTNTDFVWYGLVKSTLKNWILEPGINIHWFTSQNYYSFEPRLQVKYNISPTYSLSFATGLYAQDLLSSVSEQDITCLFQGYYSNPEYIQSSYKGKEIGTTIQKSAHGVAGITAFYPNNLKLTAEVFVKDFYRLVNFNRNKVYEDTEQNTAVIEYLKKNFIFENGWSYGLDLLADYQNDDFSFWLGYSLAFSTREDEYSSFTPHFDRRHNLNLLINYQPTKKTSIKARWNLSSGYPFTQNAGLYEEIRLTGGTLLQSAQTGNLAVYYGTYNEGRLPWYHRLDISAYKTLDLSPKVTLELNAGIMNVYNRKNVFYLDRLSGKRLDQLPIMPNAGMVLRF